MNTPTTPPPDRERAALLNLLGDADPGVFAAVRERILAGGPSVCAWLRPHALSADPILRKHAQAILQHFERGAADREFTAFCLRHGADLDLETGALLLARTAYPDVNPAAYGALLDDYAETLRPRLAQCAGPGEQIAAINALLFGQLAFRGNEADYYDPRNNYLNQVLDRRMGNPIGLCVVYLLVARRLKLPVVGIGLPGHFLCRYQSSVASVYIDAYGRGRLLTKSDCMQYLLQTAFSAHDQFLAPLTPRRILLRLCHNLHHSYHQRERADDARRVHGYLLALAPPTLT
jgi:regulator of sirC expression with transglutaminase-like and TPR domain